MEKLKTWRGNRSLSEVGKLCGVAAATFSRWERGLSKVEPWRVIRVERLTGISRHALRPDLYPLEDYSSFEPRADAIVEDVARQVQS